ncbi:hypothetical protein SAY87_005621 [Trapa incisa]|uniref:Galactose oxidase n=1 Tax=Trapa incisa TaxID=236973 RepID=A0AAN7Q7F9_9MYRT|nr:hypothetical protein SAY87_005618 [Trapa incisa]KAK4760728.1 hypothetical protein SAY87_005621 [Trapa incisa]
MAIVPFVRSFLVLPLLFVPALAQIRFGFLGDRFTHEKLIDGLNKLFEGNDGGLKGDAGKYQDRVDSLTGGIGGFIVPDPSFFDFPDGQKNEFALSYGGDWEMVLDNSGVSAMHMQLMPHNEALIFDSTVLGPSMLALPHGDRCRAVKDNRPDCWAHAVMYDIETGAVRPLHIDTDPWCSSGALTVNGSLLSTGGFMDGAKSVRTIAPCKTCDWKDTPNVLGSARWYATQVRLEDGSFMVIGGRRSYNYELVLSDGRANGLAMYSAFIDETSDLDENNLYPFVHLLPDGNLFIFANSRSILFNPFRNRVVKEFPRLLGGSRNYPASGMSTLLPIRLNGKTNDHNVQTQVLVCGGASPKAYRLADPEKKDRILMDALKDCGRLVVSDPNPKWMRENMPSPRIMGDMLNLPTGDILIINGAQKGTAAWNHAAEPNNHPVLFSPEKIGKDRFKVLKGSTIPRMYHSTSMLLPDGRILVGGSNTNPTYKFEGVEYPTEMRLEKFSPPYLDPLYQHYRPQILKEQSDNRMTFNSDFRIKFRIGAVLVSKVSVRDIKVTMYSPPFTTHGYSMNQRLIQLGITELVCQGGVQHVTARAPPSGRIAPPGYYLVFLVYRGIPSVGIWIQIL